MDPLSITASSIAVAHIVHLSLKAASAFRHANPELIALYNEISDLLTVLHELENVLEQRAYLREGLPSIAGIAQAVVSVKSKLEHLSTQVTKWSPHNAPNRPADTAARLRRLGVAYQAKRFKEEFKNLREGLTSYLAVFGLSTTSRIELDLKQVLLLTQHTDERHQDLQAFIRSKDSTSTPDLENERPAADPSGLPDDVQFSDTGNEYTDEPFQETAIHIGSTRAFHHNGRVLFDSQQLTAVSAVGIRTAHLPRTACAPWCSCACHSETRIQTPPFLQSIFGSLFIGYSGIPVLTKPCSERACALRAQPMSYITYFFPPWFLSRMVSLMLTSTPLAGPVISLKTQRTVPGTADIFTYAKLGNVDKMQALFENGLASPHDVHYESGITALHLAISHQHVKVCKYLLDMNADPFLEDRARWTAADNAWDKILTRTFPAETERALRLMFSETECVERREFTLLHKVVLGLTPGDLGQLLQGSTADLDTVDNNGRTPVSLAAELGDLHALNTLLEYRPNVNISCTNDSTPLHFAACAKDPSCIAPLIDADATIDACTNWKQTPLIYAAAYTKDARHAEVLLDAGADIDHRDLDGINALGWTATADNVPVAEVLIRRGADLTNVDCSGETVITSCVANNRVEILKRLIGRRLVCSAQNRFAKALGNILLIAAQHATLDTINALSQLALEGIEAEITNADGKAWREVLKVRLDYDASIAQAMERLADKILGGRMYPGVAGEDDEEGSEFEDALEQQES